MFPNCFKKKKSIGFSLLLLLFSCFVFCYVSLAEEESNAREKKFSKCVQTLFLSFVSISYFLHMSNRHMADDYWMKKLKVNG